MIESAPCCAPTSPPLTGASSIVAPFSSTFWASSRVTTGEMVLMSISNAPSLSPSSTPSSPATTRSTSGESGSMVMTTSDRSATSLGLSATVAPSPASSSAFSLVRLYRTSSWPASIRFRAIGLPMMPSPMKPTVSAIASSSKRLFAPEPLKPSPRYGSLRSETLASVSRSSLGSQSRLSSVVSVVGLYSRPT